MKIALITDQVGWHSTRLMDAFARHGCEVRAASLRQCEFSTRFDSGWLIPGFDAAVPDGVFVRGVPGGSFEQVTFYLDVLHAMEHLKVFVYNDVCAIERSVDKVMTGFLFKRAGVATPDTYAGSDREQAARILEKKLAAGERLVIKPVFGSQGKGLRLAEPGVPLPELPEDDVYYLQAFIDSGGELCRDWRLFVVGGRVVAAMERVGSHWINNFAQGGECRRTEIDEAMRTLAVAAVDAVDMAYAGVDLMKDAAGNLWVTEVNSIPAWKGLQGVVDIDIAEVLVVDFLRRLRAVRGNGG